MTQATPQPFAALVKRASVRIARATFNGLFDMDLIVTSRDELEAASEACRSKVFVRETGRHEQRLNEDQFRAWLASRVAGYDRLTLKMAMTLCGRDLPDELLTDADAPLACEPETTTTLLNMVVGMQPWLLAELGTIAITQVTRDQEATKN